MKRYALFVCERNAAHGGWDDFKEAFEGLELAKRAGLQWAEKHEATGIRYWHVVDVEQGRVAARGPCYAYERDDDDFDLEDEERSQR